MKVIEESVIEKESLKIEDFTNKEETNSKCQSIHKDYEENANLIIHTMHDTHMNLYNRTQVIDNRNGFLIALHAAIIAFIPQYEKISNVLGGNYSNFKEEILALIFIICSILFIICGIISIFLFIISLKTRDMKDIPTDYCDDEYVNRSGIELKKDLLANYKEINEYNDTFIIDKHKFYKWGLNCTILEVVFLFVSLMLNIFI